MLDPEENKTEINLTDQGIGEVQIFVDITVVLLKQFYNFNQLIRENRLVEEDIEALEDDIHFIIHKLVVTHQVFETLVILNRLDKKDLNKKFRDKYRLI